MRYARNWPVLTAYDDLAAYAAHKGGRIPTEPELRLFLDTYQLSYAEGANAGFRHWHPLPATAARPSAAGRRALARLKSASTAGLRAVSSFHSYCRENARRVSGARNPDEGQFQDDSAVVDRDQPVATTHATHIRWGFHPNERGATHTHNSQVQTKEAGDLDFVEGFLAGAKAKLVQELQSTPTPIARTPTSSGRKGRFMPRRKATGA
ncbi:hypothetical protein NUW54_g11851 [Trametes sanguinea]|uniref:Uncharacterized protein n=1 Tax=Trametes sanguinea TaxID=158606 RepID=A0ACC1N8D6_9APHY|nr:hypothetical protein NUW54_g11851 [Trametes sanguinea]